MDYVAHLKKDARLATIIAEPYHQLTLRKNIPLHLIASIMSQQLNTKVADIIYNRFLNLYGKKQPTPQQILDTPFDTLRSIGLSNAKATYVQNVARFCIEHKVTDKKLLAMTDEEIVVLLTQIKGVGKWTVEMLMMFALGRQDIYAIDDWGLQNAVVNIYNLKIKDKKKLREKILKISARWSPYRSYACLHLWRWKDNAPTPKGGIIKNVE